MTHICKMLKKKKKIGTLKSNPIIS